MYDGNLENLLEENIKLAKENNKILHKIHRHIKWGRAMRIFYFILIIGSSFGAYYILQPYIDTVRESYQLMTTNIREIGELVPGVRGFIESPAVEEGMMEGMQGSGQ